MLETYYDNLINKDLFRDEQEVLAKRLVDIEARLAVAEEEFEIVKKHLEDTLELIGNCHKAYKSAPDSVRRSFNQAFFEKVYVSPNKTDGTKVVISADLHEPFLTLTKSHDLFQDRGFSHGHLVGAVGFEPTTNWL